jgi:hypothetical protein
VYEIANLFQVVVGCGRGSAWEGRQGGTDIFTPRFASRDSGVGLFYGKNIDNSCRLDNAFEQWLISANIDKSAKAAW